jgi:multidrug efflux system membrane fusion protein
MPSVPLRHRRHALAAVIVTALAALTAGAPYLHPSAAGPSNQPPPATPVPVVTVAQTEVATWDEFSGRLEAVERVDVRSRVAGAVQSIHFSEGALVSRGELLVTIDPAPYAAEVDHAEAQVVAAQARVAYTTSESERAQRLWDQSAIARRELDERSNALKEAQANLRATEAALQSARLNLGYTQVRAPVSGRVGKLEVTVGNLVAAGPGAPVLTTLVSVNPIYASFDADEQVVARALKDVANAHGQVGVIPVDLETAAGDTVLHGRLQLVDNQVNARSGTVRARAVFDNKDGVLMPGQFAKVRMGRPKTTAAVLVNERAVGTDQSKKFVMVVGADNKAEYREVSLGNAVNGLRIVTSGLEAGERIVVNGLQRVRPGSLIEPQPGSMEATSAAGSVGATADVAPASAAARSSKGAQSQRKGT